MNKILLIVFLITNVVSAQKTYKIGNNSWVYSKPENYIYKTDNFSEIIQQGKEFYKNDKSLNLNQEEDVLITIAKNEDSNFNIFYGGYFSNKNIKNFTLEGYVNKLVETFKEKYGELKTPVEITKQKIQIDNKLFYVLKNKVSNPQKNYTTYMYISEIGNKEVNLAIIVDNDIDEKILTESILNSKFK